MDSIPSNDSPFHPEWSDGRISFTVGTGRCGTTFLHRLFDREKPVAASHERNPLAATFHRYTRWHGLPVDDEGFLQSKTREIAADLERHRFSAEVSAYLSFSIPPLHERFGARFILLTRNPEAVIRSYLAKGWYEQQVAWRDRSLAPGYQDCELFHHFLGRTTPQGDAFEAWNNLTRAGKLAWFWATLNRSVLEQFATLPPGISRVQKLEGLDFEAYRELAKFLGFETTLSPRKFQKIQDSKPNRFPEPPPKRDWTERERHEIAQQASQTAAALGYAFDF